MKYNTTMNCETCPMKDFVHDYCQGCRDNPVREISGIVYLYRKNKSDPVASEAVKATGILTATRQLMRDFEVEFIPDEP